MRKYFKQVCLLISSSLFFIQFIQAQTTYTYTFTPGTGAYWGIAENWTCNSSPGDCPPGFNIAPNDTIIVDGFCNINSNETIDNQGTLIITENGTITVDELGYIQNHGRLEVYGQLFTETGSYTFQPNSQTVIHEDAAFSVDFLGTATFNNSSNLLIHGNFEIYSGGNLILNAGANITVTSTGQWLFL